MQARIWRAFSIISLIAVLVVVSSPRAWAHSGVEVGDYVVEIGFLVEPAYAGEPNALELVVTRAQGAEEGHGEAPQGSTAITETAAITETSAAEAGTAEHTEGEAAYDEVGVNGLEGALRAELIFGSRKKEFALEPLAGREGGYTVAFIPTEPGDYTWRIFGEIEGTPVDVSLTSAPDTFSPVAPKAELSFPVAEASPQELAAAAAAAAQRAQIALIVGGAGALLGVVGLVVGLIGLRRRG